MARTIPPERFTQLVEAATRAFISQGFRLTQMADVAEALGVAKGTLYGYVESKEALFDATVRYADGHLTLPDPSQLPLRTPPQGATVAYIRERLAIEAADMKLLQVVTGTLVIRDAQRELEAVLGDLYQRMARNRLAIKLVDRCAVDYPELASLWFSQGRGAQEQLLVELLESRAQRRRYRRIENPEVVARTIIETVAFWAVHRHFGSSPPALADEIAERAVVDFIVGSLLRSP